MSCTRYQVDVQMTVSSKPAQRDGQLVSWIYDVDTSAKIFDFRVLIHGRRRENHLVWNILQTQDWSGPMTSGSVSQNRQDEVHRYVRSISFCGPGTGWEVSFGFDLLIIGEPSWACVNTFGWCVHGTYSLRYEYRVQPSRQFESELTWWWQRKDLKSENEIEIR